MCGLVGFFVGCKQISVCPHLKQADKQGALPYQTKFCGWFEHSSVRNAPRRVIDQEHLRDIFNPEFIPIAGHSLIHRQLGADLSQLQLQHLYRYLDFTQKLELLIVNDTTREIALGRSIAAFSEELMMDAHSLYCDEAYHAQFSFDMIRQLEALSGSPRGQVADPSFLSTLNELLSRSDCGSERRLRRLMITIVSEMLITDNLVAVQKNVQTAGPIRRMMRDHAIDEHRHHLFYRHILRDLWFRGDRNLVTASIALVPSFVRAFVDPDLRNICGELVSMGLTLDEARQVFEETYTPQVVADYARQVSATLVKCLEELGAMSSSEVHDAFCAVGLLQ